MRIGSNLVNKVSIGVKARVLSLAMLPCSASPALAKDSVQFSHNAVLTEETSKFGTKIADQAKQWTKDITNPFTLKKQNLLEKADSDQSMKLKVQFNNSQTYKLIQETTKASVYEVVNPSAIGITPDALKDIDKVFVAKFKDPKIRPVYKVDYKKQTITNNPATNNIPYKLTITDFLGGARELREELTDLYIPEKDLGLISDVIYDKSTGIGLAANTTSKASSILEKTYSQLDLKKNQYTPITEADFSKAYEKMCSDYDVFPSAKPAQQDKPQKQNSINASTENSTATTGQYSNYSIQDFENKISNLNDQLNAKNNELSAKQTLLNNTTNNLSIENSNYSTYKMTKSMLDSSLATMSIYGPVVYPPEYFSLQNKVSEAASNINKLNIQKTQTENDITKLNKEIADIKGQLDSITETYNAKKASMPKKQQAPTVTQNSSPATSAPKQAQKTINTTKLSNAEFSQKMDKYINDQNEQSSDQTKLILNQSKIMMDQSDISSLDSEINNLNSALDITRRASKSESEIADDLKDTMWSPVANSASRNGQDAVSDYENQISQKQYKKQMKESEIANLTNENIMLNNRISQLDQEIAQLKRELNL